MYDSRRTRDAACDDARVSFYRRSICLPHDNHEGQDWLRAGDDATLHSDYNIPVGLVHCFSIRGSGAHGRKPPRTAPRASPASGAGLRSCLTIVPIRHPHSQPNSRTARRDSMLCRSPKGSGAGPSARRSPRYQANPKNLRPKNPPPWSSNSCSPASPAASRRRPCRAPS